MKQHRRAEVLAPGRGAVSAEREPAFEARRPTMAAELAPDHTHVRNPVQLHRPALADMRPMAVKRPLAASKRQHCSGERRDLAGAIFEIAGPAQQPQPTLRPAQTGFR